MRRLVQLCGTQGMTETKRDKFDRMFEPRLEKAVKAISLLGNLARKSDYEWTNKQIQGMLDALHNEIDILMEKFDVKQNEAEPEIGTAAGLRQPVYGDDVDLPADRVSDRGMGGAITGHDKAAIKQAYLQIAKDDRVHGMKALRSVILGWGHISKPNALEGETK